MPAVGFVNFVLAWIVVAEKHIDKNRFETYNSHIEENRYVRCAMDKRQQAKVFKAFCDETRLQVLAMLGEGEMCACVLLESLEIGQSTLSHHMKILVDSGVVVGRKDGKWTHYSLSASGSAQAVAMLQQVLHLKGKV